MALALATLVDEEVIQPYVFAVDVKRQGHHADHHRVEVEGVWNPRQHSDADVCLGEDDGGDWGVAGDEPLLVRPDGKFEGLPPVGAVDRLDRDLSHRSPGSPPG